MKNTKYIHNHFYGLDLLRGISGYGVAICHFYAFIYENIFLEYLSFIFVEFFFVLSGFVLFPQLIKIFENKKNIIIFYKRRWLRTIPLYLTCLIVISLMFNEFLSFDFFKYFFFIQDVFPNYLKVDYYPVVWSLSIEEFFYLIFPIFLIIINKKNFFFKTALLFSFLFFFKLLFINNYDSNFIRISTFFRFDAILFGFLLRSIYFKFNFYQTLFLSSFFLFLYIFFQDFILNNNNLLYIKFGFIILLQLLSASILLFFLKIETFIRFSFLKKLCSLVSKQTYAVYLTHMILIYLLIDLKITGFDKFSLYFLLLIAISTISYYFLEKPILKIRPKYL